MTSNDDEIDTLSITWHSLAKVLRFYFPQIYIIYGASFFLSIHPSSFLSFCFIACLVPWSVGWLVSWRYQTIMGNIRLSIALRIYCLLALFFMVLEDGVGVCMRCWCTLHTYTYPSRRVCLDFVGCYGVLGTRHVHVWGV